MRAEDLLVGPRGRYLCWALTELLYQGLPEADVVAAEVARTVDRLASTSDVAGVVFAALTPKSYGATRAHRQIRVSGVRPVGGNCGC